MRRMFVCDGETLPLGGEADRMADARDGFSLERGGGGQKGTGGSKDNPCPFSLPHSAEKIAVQHRGGTTAAGSAGMHILVLPVVEQQATVLKVGPQLDAVLGEEIPDDGMAHLAQVTGDDQIIVIGRCLCVPKESGESIIGGGGRSQGCTMWKMFSVKFNAYSSPEARRF